MNRKAVKASAGATLFSLATLVGAVGLAGGCHRYNEPPFNPREGAAPVVITDEDHWSGFRPDKIDELASRLA